MDDQHSAGNDSAAARPEDGTAGDVDTPADLMAGPSATEDLGDADPDLGLDTSERGIRHNQTDKGRVHTLTLLERILALATAVLTLATAGLGLWGTRANTERNELEEANANLEQENSTIAEERADLQDQLTESEDQVQDLQDDLATTTTTTPGDEDEDPQSPVDGPMVFLDELDVVEHGGSTRDGIYTEETAHANGITYNHALVGGPGCRSTADAWVDYDLSRDWSTFTTTVGLSDDSSTDSSVSFAIYLDGQEVEGGNLRLGMSVPVEVDVTDGLRLRLEVVDPTAPESCSTRSNVVFGDPELVR